MAFTQQLIIQILIISFFQMYVLIWVNFNKHLPHFRNVKNLIMEFLLKGYILLLLSKEIYNIWCKRYWDFLWQLNHDFLESPRGDEEIRQFLNEDRLLTAGKSKHKLNQCLEQMQNYYFEVCLNYLVTELEGDIDKL